MTQALASIVRALPRDVIDDVMIQSVSSDMRARLAEKRAEGFGGWQGADCSIEGLFALLLKNLRQGDMIDVINLAGMIHLRRNALGEPMPERKLAFGLEAANREPPAVLVHNTHGAIDIRDIRMDRIGADGAVITDDRPHVAVLLPQFGLMFDAGVPQAARNHDHARELASSSRVLGFNDWRLPEVEELQLLIRRDRCDPAIDTEAFPHTPTDDWYWTNTARASASGCAWGVAFGYGGVGSDDRSYSGLVRAVRRVSPSQ